MPTFEIGLDDGRTLHIEADSHEAALAGVQHFLGNNSAPAAQPSGVIAGVQHGISDLANSDRETAKDFYGVGSGKQAPADPNYVPANVTNGSINPLDWNGRQIPQKIAEMVPGLAQDIAAAKVAGLAARPLGPKAAILAGLGGGAVSAWHRMAGNDAKADAVRRTGDENAQPEGQDLARAGLTDAASSAVASLLPMRFGASAPTITNVGRAGVSDAVKKYLTTAADSAAATGGSDAVSQLGNTGTIDPKQTLEAAAGGAITGSALAAPRGVADAGKAVRFREFGGDNQNASEAVASRLTDAAPEGLGNAIGGSKVDARALGSVKSNLKGELQTAASAVRNDPNVQLSTDANNALRRAQRGEALTADDVQLLDHEAPGTNAAFLARQTRVAQLLQDTGTYSDGKWAGGVSGMLDKAIGKWLPKAAFISAAGEATGHDFIGAYAPHVIGGALGGYAAARAVDATTGMRSPAKTFADTFQNAQAMTRLPPPPQPAPPPRPPTPPSVPPVAPPQASPWGYPQPQAPAPAPLNANALNQQVKGALLMAAARRKMAAQTQATQQSSQVTQAQPLLQQLAASRTPPAAPTPAPIDPLNLPSDITKPSANVMKGLLLKQRLMAQNVPEPAPSPEPQPMSPAPVPAEVDPTALPKDITAPAKSLMSALARVQKMKDAATEKPAKITKSNGKVNSSAPIDPYAAHEANPFYEPLPSEAQYKNGMTVDQIADHEAQNVHPARREKYRNGVRDTTSERISRLEDIANDATPNEAHALAWLKNQLLHRNSAEQGMRAIVHVRSQLSPETYSRVKASFSPDVMARVFNNK